MINIFKNIFPKKNEVGGRDIPNAGTANEDMQNSLHPIQGEALKSLLDISFSPVLYDLGLKWAGNYYWIGENQQGIRKVFHYSLLKGYRGHLEWGVSIDFIPLVSGSRLFYSRTEKSTKLHLFEWPKGYTCAFHGEKFVDGIGVASHHGEENTVKTLNQAINVDFRNIKDWFGKASTLEGVLEIAQEQVKGYILERTGKCSCSNMYTIHYPSPKYVLCFLLGEAGKMEEALELFDSLYDYEISMGISSELREKIRNVICRRKDNEKGRINDKG